MARKAARPPVLDTKELEAGEEDSVHEIDEELASEIREQTMSKAGAARAALANGIMVPKQASAYIKRKYDIDISPQQFSAEKSRLKLRSGGEIPFTNSDSSRSHGEGFSGLNGQTDLLHALELIKPLIDQLGAEKVKRMVDLLD